MGDCSITEIGQGLACSWLWRKKTFFILFSVSLNQPKPFGLSSAHYRVCCHPHALLFAQTFHVHSFSDTTAFEGTSKSAVLLLQLLALGEISIYFDASLIPPIGSLKLSLCDFSFYSPSAFKSGQFCYVYSELFHFPLL